MLRSSLCLALLALLPWSAQGQTEPAPPPLQTQGEALARARLLHDTFAETLRVVHRDFFRRDEHLPFPSQSLSEVFETLAAKHRVQLRWIAAEDTAMNLDHLPADEFEKKALATLVEGRAEHWQAEKDEIRFAGRIVLQNKCLKCHLQNRTSLGERSAGLAIRLPYRSD